MTATVSILEEMPLALADLYEQHHRMVFSTAYRITGNVADAEDVLHTVFVRLLRRDETDLIGNAEGYLRRAASNAALDILRARRETVPPDSERLAGTGPDPERGDLGEHLRRAIAALPERPAEMFTLRYFEGLSNREIAREMGLSPMVVAVTLHRTRKRLQKDLAQWR